MASNNDKRYSFRFNHEDEDVVEYLEQLPKNKRSEMIRYLLRYAYRSITSNQKEQDDLQDMKREIITLRKQQEQLVTKLDQGIRINHHIEQEDKRDDEDINNTSFAKTAGNLFGGIEF